MKRLELEGGDALLPAVGQESPAREDNVRDLRRESIRASVADEHRTGLVLLVAGQYLCFADPTLPARRMTVGMCDAQRTVPARLRDIGPHREVPSFPGEDGPDVEIQSTGNDHHRNPLPLEQLEQLPGPRAQRDLPENEIGHGSQLVTPKQGCLLFPRLPKRHLAPVELQIDLVGDPTTVRRESLDELDRYVRLDQSAIEVEEHTDRGWNLTQHSM